MKFALAGLLAIGGAALVAAHKEPSTPEEVKAYRDLQASAYHCAPAVAAYTAARKRSWAQKVLGGDSLAHKDLFIEGAYDDLGTEAAEGSKKQLVCDEVAETQIKNHTCVLAPETTQGPYYHTEGHPIRSNMAEYQLGLLFLMDVGVIDVNTCKPIENVLVDVWHANATGHYAGHPVPAKGKENEQPQVGGKRSGLLSAYPRTNDHETWLRAALPSDKNGLAQFTSIFPGYYTGRATHVHVRVHTDYEVMPNNTFRSNKLVHTGQFFVPDEINIEIDKLWPYSENPIRETRGRTRNWRDSLNIFDEAHENDYQATFDMQMLGGVLQQGLIGYITVGIDPTVKDRNAAWSP